MPGAAWCVTEQDRVAARGVAGFAALRPAPRALTEQTPFDLASLTKPLVVGLLLALLEQERVLDLDAPVERWVPELGGSPYGPRSPACLAAHASGLPAWHPLFAGARDLEGYLAQIAGLAPAVPAGRVLYSDLGYIVLGAVLERATGLPLDTLFDRRVAGPLALSRAAFARDPARFADAAATECASRYERDLPAAAGRDFVWREALAPGEVHDTNAWGLGGVAGHAGLFGTLDDVMRLAGAILRPSALALEERARRRLLEPASAGQGRTMGLVLAGSAAAARGILPAAAPGHTGFTGTSLWLDPPRGRVFALLTNRIHPWVPVRTFSTVRRGFHRAALAALR